MRLFLLVAVVCVAFGSGYGYHAYLHRSDLSAAEHWRSMGEMGGKYSIVKGQREAARDQYLKERQEMLQVGQEDANATVWS